MSGFVIKRTHSDIDVRVSILINLTYSNLSTALTYGVWDGLHFSFVSGIIWDHNL